MNHIHHSFATTSDPALEGVEYYDTTLSPYLIQKQVVPFEISTSVFNCMKCPLSKYAKPLSMEMPNYTSLMIIAEDPSDVSEEFTKGKDLKNFFEQLNIDFKETYFTSIVKCVGSTHDENCHHHLISEILANQPLVILALGYRAGAPFLRHIAEGDVSNGQLKPGDGYTLSNGSDMVILRSFKEVYHDEYLFQEFRNHVQLGLQRLHYRKNNQGV